MPAESHGGERAQPLIEQLSALWHAHCHRFRRSFARCRQHACSALILQSPTQIGLLTADLKLFCLASRTARSMPEQRTQNRSQMRFKMNVARAERKAPGRLITGALRRRVYW